MFGPYYFSFLATFKGTLNTKVKFLGKIWCYLFPHVHIHQVVRLPFWTVSALGAIQHTLEIFLLNLVMNQRIRFVWAAKSTNCDRNTTFSQLSRKFLSIESLKHNLLWNKQKDLGEKNDICSFQMCVRVFFLHVAFTTS